MPKKISSDLKKTKILTFRVPENIWELYEKQSIHLHLTVSDLVRNAVSKELSLQKHLNDKTNLHAKGFE